jgi:hypothetical protein
VHGAGSYDGEASFNALEYRDAGKTERFEGECSVTTKAGSPSPIQRVGVNQNSTVARYAGDADELTPQRVPED